LTDKELEENLVAPVSEEHVLNASENPKEDGDEDEDKRMKDQEENIEQTQNTTGDDSAAVAVDEDEVRKETSSEVADVTSTEESMLPEKVEKSQLATPRVETTKETEKEKLEQLAAPTDKIEILSQEAAMPSEQEVTEQLAAPTGEIVMATEIPMELDGNASSEEVAPLEQENLPSQKVNKAKGNLLVKPDIIPRQKPKSGKFWKVKRSQFRSIKKDRGPRLTFEQRVKRKEETEQAKELAQMLKQRKYQKKQEMKEKIEANKKRKEENEKKAEIYQIIKNPAKIKRMKKKQLRMLAKRDTLEVKSAVVES